MKTAPMCFAVVRVPRCRVYSWVNAWWEGFDSLSRTCKEGHSVRLIGSSACGRGGNNRKWSTRPITTRSEGRSEKVLSSAANVRHGITNEIVTALSTNLGINKLGDSNLLPIQHTDVRQLIVENKELAKLATFLVFDLETTGFKRDDDRIIEIALQDLQGGENSTFHTLVNPGRDVPYKSTEVHGIKTFMVRRPGVPRMEDLVPILLQYVQSRQKEEGYVVLVAHNARCFDVPFLVHEFARCSMEIPKNWYFVDTLPLAREVMIRTGTNGRPKVSLQALREHYSIQLVGRAHSALSDVHSLALVLQKMTYDLKRSIPELVQQSFTANELTISSTKKKKDSS